MQQTCNPLSTTKNGLVMFSECLPEKLLFGQVKGIRPPPCHRFSFNGVALHDCQNFCIGSPDKDAQQTALERQGLPCTYLALIINWTANRLTLGGCKSSVFQAHKAAIWLTRHDPIAMKQNRGHNSCGSCVSSHCEFHTLIQQTDHGHLVCCFL